MKYKVGDKVKVKSINWYNENKSNLGFINCLGVCFTSNMSIFCGCTLTIKEVGYDVYYTEENLYAWTEDMFEGIVDYKENIEITLNDKNYIIDVEKAKELGVLKEKDTRCKSWEEFKKKYQYNTCFYFNNYTDNIEKSCDSYDVDDQFTKEEAIAIDAFSKLLKLRRDWIGNWNPDWFNGSVRKYYIEVRKNEFYIDYHYVNSRTFSFPTKEMAEEFLNCFRNLFEQCKNLI